ncbi:TPA: hypothetical protein ACSP74_004133, partial [Aeromonas veronii]
TLLPVSRYLVTVRAELCVSGSGASTLFLPEKRNLSAFDQLLVSVAQKPNNLLFFKTLPLLPGQWQIKNRPANAGLSWD